jgi:hypothetical protein
MSVFRHPAWLLETLEQWVEVLSVSQRETYVTVPAHTPEDEACEDLPRQPVVTQSYWGRKQEPTIRRSDKQ